MNTRATGILDSSLLSAATVLGIALASAFPYIGLPIAAAGLSGLVFHDRWTVAGFAAVLGAAVVVALDLTEAVFVVPALLAIFFAIVMMPRLNVQVVMATLVGVLTAASTGMAALSARLVGTTLPAQIAADAAQVVNEVGVMLGPSASSGTMSRLRSSAELLSSTWPSAYFGLAVLTSVFVIAAIGWSARRLGRPIEIPSLVRLDLTMHVLWVFVVGLFLLALSYTAIQIAAAMGVVGLNLLLCARAFLLLQGLSVMAAVLEKVGIRSVGRVLGLAGFALLDTFTLAVSFTGLVDFWVNFRRLPRDGSPPAAPEHEASDR